MKPEITHATTTPVQGHKFNVGDKVVFTNDYGICFGVYTVRAKIPHRTVPMYSVGSEDGERVRACDDNLSKADEDDLNIPDAVASDFFREKYGRKPTQEQLEALLDTDSFDGESTHV